ncbi:hypothetical protein KI387_022044, partial [Taxus chinensis]
NAELSTSESCQLGIFWDLRGCRVPRGVPYDTVAANIKCFLTSHDIDERITTFNVYGDASKLPQTFIKACNKTGIKIIDEKDKDSALRAMLVDMVIYAIDSSSPFMVMHAIDPPPSKILLISGRRSGDFFPLLCSLHTRWLRILLAVPNLKKTCPYMLRDFGKTMWEWSAMAMAGCAGQGQLSSLQDSKSQALLRHEIPC